MGKRRRWRWHPETLVCSFQGHQTPAARVARLRPEDRGLGIDLDDGRRFARCIRCDAWVVTEPPRQPEHEALPPFAEIALPKRGKALRDLIVLRLIAIDRGIHALVFGIIAVGLIVLRYKLPLVQAEAQDVLNGLGTGLVKSGNPGRDFLVHLLERVLRLSNRNLRTIVLIALGYMVVEGVEAIGLWLQYRWAEYLTVVATAGFVPFEIDEILKRVTVFRVSALVINLAIVLYLVWAKRLFGLRGGEPEDERLLEAAELLAPPPGIQAAHGGGQQPAEAEAGSGRA
jgi:uncharacterized membrane protein (DUF2068 family)